MKLNRFALLAIIVALMNGCVQPMGGNWNPYGEWNICNQTSHEIVVQINFASDSRGDISQIVGTQMTAKIASEHESLMFYLPNYVDPEQIVISFGFANGVTHIFEGDLIDHDVRAMESWTVEYKYEGHWAYHTYTFTDEDYERIMALHTNNAN